MDGSVIVSDPGIGVIKAGWHCGGNPSPVGSAGTCPSCRRCQGSECVANVGANGNSCDDRNACTVNDKCTSGQCVGEIPQITLSAFPKITRNLTQGEQCNECTNQPNGTACSDEGTAACTIDKCSGGACEHEEVTAVTAYAPDPEPLNTTSLNANTQTAISCLRDAVTAAGGTFRVTSGYRAQGYQDHLREVWDKYQKISGWNEPECDTVRTNITTEWNRHGMVHQPGRTSDHTSGTGFDAGITLPSTADIDTLATGCSLTRRVHGDAVHFTR